MQRRFSIGRETIMVCLNYVKHGVICITKDDANFTMSCLDEVLTPSAQKKALTGSVPLPSEPVEINWTSASKTIYTRNMDHLIPAVFDSGVFRPLEPVELAEGTQVEVQVPTASSGDLVVPPQRDTLTWPEFIEQTYGSCAGVGLERHEQGDLESREPFA